MATTAFIGLGSNLGDRESYLQSAINALRVHPHIVVNTVSSIYETEPVGGPPDQADYLNAVVEIQTDLGPRELLNTLLEIELQLGRERKVKNGPRTIDLDLLFYGDDIIDEEGLCVPHPRLHKRGFVLEPLAEIAPDKIHPLLGTTVGRLWEDFDPDKIALETSATAHSQGKPLEHQRALVTGSTSGIGRAIALALAAAGADVIVHGRRATEAESVADVIEAMEVKTGVIIADLYHLDECERLAQAAWNVWNGIDIWVNNAGVDILTGEAARWPYQQKLRALFEVDVMATMHLSRDVGQRMKKAGHGVILNMGWDQSDVGMEGDSGQLFGASKAAVAAFSKSLALTLAPEVRVNCLAPGWIRTKWGERASEYWQARAVKETPLGRWGTPEDVAATACWLASPAASFITGQVVRVNGGAVR